MKIEVNRLFKNFVTTRGTTTVLEDINFSIEAGEFVCFVGPSGCGKSTLLNIIAGLDQASQGEVKMNGSKVTKPHSDRVVMFQESALFPWLNVFENVEFGLKRRLQEKTRKQVVHTFLKMVHLSQFEKSRVHELSGGMKSRVALARALALNPKVLLMDEPFAQLDSQTRDFMHQELQDIWLKTKKTILFVTHNVREAVLLADRVFVFSARPGSIKNEFKIQLAYPRISMNQDVVEYTQKITAELQTEVDQVIKKEVDEDWHAQKDHFLQSLSAALGSDI